jgi:SAM-dependent methyltransferase
MNASLPEIFAGGFDRYDGTIQFYQPINALLQPDFVVVDFGAGRGRIHIDDPIAYRRSLTSLKGKVKEVIGVDVDRAVTTNPAIDRAIVISGPELPLPDCSVDLILSDFTFEHLGDPQAIARNFARVPKPGGWICARTPNRFGYIALANSFLPDSLRSRVLRGAQPERKQEDVFPAFYRLNTLHDISRLFPEPRFRQASYYWDASPSYHFDSPLVFQLFSWLHSVSLNVFKTMLMVFIQKSQ